MILAAILRIEQNLEWSIAHKSISYSITYLYISTQNRWEKFDKHYTTHVSFCGGGTESFSLFVSHQASWASSLFNPLIFIFYLFRLYIFLASSDIPPKLSYLSPTKFSHRVVEATQTVQWKKWNKVLSAVDTIRAAYHTLHIHKWCMFICPDGWLYSSCCIADVWKKLNWMTYRSITFRIFIK